MTTVTSSASSITAASPVHTSTAYVTETLSPTGTPTPALLWLPGMAGFQPTPTYDPGISPPATPVQPLPCPQENTAISVPPVLTGWLGAIASGSLAPDRSITVLNFLNQGGSVKTFVQAAQMIDPELAYSADLTNDGQPELILRAKFLYVIGCSPSGSGAYEILGQFVDDIDLVPPRVIAIQDLNRDGFAELLFRSRAFGGTSTTNLLRIQTWNGRAFGSPSVLSPEYPNLSRADLEFWDDDGELWGILYHSGSIEVQDADQNGSDGFIIKSGIPGYWELYVDGPWRRVQDAFGWNGEAYVLIRSTIDPPVYRFQAVHDADQAVLWGDHERAMALYQEVISNDLLLGWSPEMYAQQEAVYFAGFHVDPTPTPVPTSAEEYYHLAAYAHFRILLIHALHGYDQDAHIEYDTLQEKFPLGQPGHASAMLAEAFWSNYLETHDVSQACPQALNAMVEKAGEILYWLDGDFHGRQAPRYHEVDLCPYGQQSP